LLCFAFEKGLAFLDIGQGLLKIDFENGIRVDLSFEGFDRAD
jgi:hypothetical protein